jgi:PTS system mannose-specific IIA component
MIGLVAVSHGNLAAELVKVTELILGSQEQLVAVSLAPDEEIDTMKERIAKAIKSVNKGDGVIVLTDMFGGTPSNLSLTFLEEGRCEILSGFNLPMLLKLASGRTVETGDTPKSLSELAKVSAEHGRSNIMSATEILRK